MDCRWMRAARGLGRGWGWGWGMGASMDGGGYGDQLFAGILFFEGVAILVTWILLLNWGHSNWMISLCGLVAGLHFFPLAWSIHQNSYYFLGIWTCLVAMTGHWLIRSGNMIDHDANVLVAYGCALAAIVDGVVVIIRTRNLIKR